MSQTECPIIGAVLLETWRVVARPPLDSSLQHELHLNREIDVDRLAVLQAGLVAPLLDGRDRGVVEAELRARRLEYLDVADAPVLADDRLQDHAPLDLRLARDL